MTSIITIDTNGAISLPKSFLDKFLLKPGATLLADVSDEGITVRPESLALRPEDESESREASLVDRNGFLVLADTQPFDAVQVIMEARADREEDLSSHRIP